MVITRGQMFRIRWWLGFNTKVSRVNEPPGHERSEITMKLKSHELLGGDMWIETKDKMPESGAPVLVFVQGVYGNKTRRLRASYAAKHTLVQSELANDDNVDYDETTDEYYCAEGWYETNEFEEVHWRIDGEVTHWMPLPEPPNAALTGERTEEK